MNKLQISYYITGHNTPSKIAHDTGVSLETAKNFLESQESYQRFKPIHYSSVPNYRISSVAPEWYLQADLADISQWSRLNDGYKYVLTIVDVFSKKAWGVPLKAKDAKSVADAMKSVIEKENMNGLKIKSDPGTEFRNSTMREMEQTFNIVHIFSKAGLKTRTGNEMGVIEAFNKTLKTALNRMMEARGSKKWIEFLNQVIETYNDTPHSTTKQKPLLFHENVVAMHNERHRLMDLPYVVNTGIQEGDRVRLLKKRGTFDKGTEPRWTKEVFKVVEVNPIMVRVEGKAEPFRFYEVQKIERAETFPEFERTKRNEAKKTTNTYHAKAERELQKLGNPNVETGKRKPKAKAIIE